MNVPTITPNELADRCAAGKILKLIDVRTPVEFRELHASFARNVPLDRLDQKSALQMGDCPPEEPLYVICRSGNRGRQACERLMAAGHANVVNVDGGTLAWAEAGLPVVRGRKSVSLERQVRIAAGLLVLIGVTLGWLVHPAFAGLSAFVGAGLVLSGVTDTCGMGLLLARMPWNRGGDGAACRDGAACGAP